MAVLAGATDAAVVGVIKVARSCAALFFEPALRRAVRLAVRVLSSMCHFNIDAHCVKWKEQKYICETTHALHTHTPTVQVIAKT